ncbi:DEAD/DEAH box helicase [Amphibacillus jilinensis]|uniref:DEAD/DEAH box helicase n=1 Tax=Amphibacillus jilinensis TaxID=1216008 RepID=UPI0002DE1855|nr:AAA domain-containing protein [Amphibacillus jilinensis]
MDKPKIESVLKAWHLVEALAPSEVTGKGEVLEKHYFKDNKKRIRTRWVKLNENPWKSDKVKDSKKHQVQFRYYLACFEHHKLVSFMRDIFKNDDEIINKDDKTLFSLSFLVDSNGHYIKDSMFVPFFMYVMKIMKETANVPYGELKTPFWDQMQLFEEQAQTVFINGVTADSLKSIQQVYKKYFHKLDKSSLNYLEIEVMKADQQSLSKNFNSFYINDLELILSKGENETLRQFIDGTPTDEYLDINENREYIEETLQPVNLPDGRWPSPVDHRLSLMQQVAVNQILNKNEKVSSVNGPPGTGKTTLLKDIFADIVVQRATEMIQLDNPSKAFTRAKTINLEGFHYPIYLLDLKLSQYSMVVASSNNGAVENISKDLPKRDEVIREPVKGKFKEYEELYAKEAKELSMYPSSAKDLLESNDNTWGLFSGALGKSDNIATFGWGLYGSSNDEHAFLKQLEHDSKQVNIKDWEDAKRDFLDIFKNVQQKKEDLQKLHDEFKRIQAYTDQLKSLEDQLLTLEQEQINLEHEKQHLERQKKLTEQQIKSQPKPSLFKRIFGKNDKKNELKIELNDIITRLKEEENKRHLKRKKINEDNKTVEELKEKISILTKQLNDYSKQGLILPKDDYWSNTKQAYEFRQLNTLWLTDELNFNRGLLFLKAMKIHKLILAFNFKAIKSTLRILINRTNLDLNDKDHREYLRNMWQSIHLITPLISTTFASFSSMYKGIEEDFINYLFIDEAGQANPQQSAGAIWRSKKVIAVGDPIQIEPVVTIDKTILGDIKKYFNLNDKYIGIGTSVQTLADAANPYGMYNSYGQRVGTPLWVHRRCLNPMFSISNKIAYDNKMVLGKNGQGKGVWLDCKGSAIEDQFVKEQGDLVADHVVELWKKTSGPPNAYIISPFTAVKKRIKKILEERLTNMNISKEILNDWLKNSVGTVHTFQGKEADIVYLVTGTDENSDGAANWSCSKPNLINVAVTRAKEELYVIGDYNRFSKKPNYSTLTENIAEVINENVRKPSCKMKDENKIL